MVYVSNESDQSVYFDNLQVVQNRGQILDEKHYYPSGLLMAGISSSAACKLPTQYGYQGKEMQNNEFSDGSGLEEYDFEARYYDQQLGVWHNQDPASQYASPYCAMGNNWPNGVDLSGGWFGWDDLAVAGAGFLTGYISSGFSTGDWGAKSLENGAIDAVMFDIGYNISGASSASGLASGLGFQGTANAVTEQYIGNAVASSVASQFLPSMNFPITNNFSVSVSPSASLSGGVGFSIGANYTDGDFSFGISEGFRGNETRLGGGVSYKAGGTSYSLFTTYFGSGSTSPLAQVLSHWRKCCDSITCVY